MHSKSIAGAALALFGSLAAAQTFTECDPTKKDCPPDPAVGGTVEIDFTKGEHDFFELADGTTLEYDSSHGAVFSIENEKQAPTIASPEYIFFGKLEVELKVAPGAGIVTSIVLQSDTLDEIDWEWLGGNPNSVQTNYFSKGDTSTYDRGGEHHVDDSVGNWHTYTIDWTKESLTWSIDGNPIRVLTYEDAKGGSIYPQSPCQIKLGSWVAGRSDAPEGTVQWAGGYANFDNGPSIAYYRRVEVTDYMGGEKAAKQYTYSDRSGTWESILVDGEGLEDKEVDDEEKPTETTGSTNSTATAAPTPSSTSEEDSSEGEDEAAGSEDGAEEPGSGASALQSFTFAGVVLSGVAVFANLI